VATPAQDAWISTPLCLPEKSLVRLDRHADEPHGMIRSRAVFRLPAQVDDLVADDACVTIGV
jgi:hypothetical protein